MLARRYEIWMAETMEKNYGGLKQMGVSSPSG